jgi:hypothetical protein
LFHSHFKLVMLPGVFVAMLFISVVFVDGWRLAQCVHYAARIGTTPELERIRRDY